MTEEWWAPVPSLDGRDAERMVDARLEALLGAASGPVNWRTVLSADAADQWSELREWVGWFRSELALDHRVVPPCWYRHRALVSVLSALRDHWVCAYDPLNTPVGASDWHRALMQLEPRLREWAARTGCTASVHRRDVTPAHPDDAQEWGTHVARDVAMRSEREATTAIGTAAGGFEVDGPAGRGVTADG